MRFLALALTLLALTLPLRDGHAAAYKYDISLALTMPAGSAGATLAAGMPKNTKISPCSSATTPDQLTVTLKYDAGKVAADKRDVYMIFYRPDARGTAVDPKFFPIVKRFPGSNYQVTARKDVADLNYSRFTDIYVSTTNNLGGAITETILGGNIVLEALPSGLWMTLAIIADSGTIDFDDPGTWLAWDAAPFMLRKPWEGSALRSCL